MEHSTLAQRKSPRIGILPIAIALLTLITAGIHLYLGLRMGGGPGSGGGPSGNPPLDGANSPNDGNFQNGGGTPPSGGPPGGGPGGSSIMGMLPLPLPILFILNGMGYIGLLIAYYLPALRRFQWLTRWALIAFTAITIILWALMDRDPDLMAYADKLVEAALIVLLLIDGWLLHRRPKPHPGSQPPDYEVTTSQG